MTESAVRWEGSETERFNIETTSRGFVSHPDEFYLTWPTKANEEHVKRYQWLQSESQEMEVAGMLGRRAQVFKMNGRYGDAAFEYLQAFFQAPKVESRVDCIVSALMPWRNELRAQVGPGFPGMNICQGPRRHPDLPTGIANELNYLNALEKMLNNPDHKARWWDPLRREPSCRPQGLPEWVQVTYPREPGGPIKYEACQKPTNSKKTSEMTQN